MTCIINRRSQFSASHRYWLSELSETENVRRFGKCTSSPGHGHNYVLNVSITGAVDPYGMVLDLGQVKRIVHQQIIEPLNFSYLNEVWPEFSQTLPTTEHIARIIWHRLSASLPLLNIQLYETPDLWADYKGNGMEAYLTVSTHFCAAHRLALPSLTDEENTQLYGKCANPNGHGHNYQLEVTVKGPIDKRTGMIVDLVSLQKAIAHYATDQLDHTFLNKDVPHFTQAVPTAENITLYVVNQLRQPLTALGTTLHKVKLIESPNNSAEIIVTP